MGVLTYIWEAIPVYTGLSPMTFFTIVAVLVAAYYMLSSMFAPPPVKYVPREPPPPPVQMGTVTEEELKGYDGTDSKKPLLMAIKGQIYDVSQSRGFYGPGGPYALFAGKDASRALARMSFEESDLTGDTEGLNAYELDALNDWEEKFQSKYVKVGTIAKPVAEGTAETVLNESAQAEETITEDTPAEARSEEQEKEAEANEE